VRAAAARAQCRNNLKQLAIGAANYNAAKGHWPSGTVANPDLAPSQRLSWLVEVLPYVEREDLYRRVDRKKGWAAETNRAATSTPVRVFLCFVPARANGDGPLTSYVGVAGLGPGAALLPPSDPRCGLFGHDRVVRTEDVKDGTSNTLLALETASENGRWAAGGAATVRGLDPETRPYVAAGGPFGVLHRDPVLFQMTRLPTTAGAAFADGSVREVCDTADPRVLEAVATIAGGEEYGPGYLP
jgi:hypothetical protein